MNLQLIIVIIAAVVSVVYIAHRMIKDWRRTHNDGCNSCPVSKTRPPSKPH